MYRLEIYANWGALFIIWSKYYNIITIYQKLSRQAIFQLRTLDFYIVLCNLIAWVAQRALVRLECLVYYGVPNYCEHHYFELGDWFFNFILCFEVLMISKYDNINKFHTIWFIKTLVLNMHSSLSSKNRFNRPISAEMNSIFHLLSFCQFFVQFLR